MIALNHSSSPQRLAIHLNDHRAIITGELALTRRARAHHVGTVLGHHLTRHLGEVSLDLDLVDALIAGIGGRIDHLKSFGALIAERLGRLKPNGQLVGSSPLSDVVELEVLGAASHIRTTMWASLLDAEVVPASFIDRVAARRDAAGEQLDQLHDHLRTAVNEAFDAASR